MAAQQQQKEKHHPLHKDCQAIEGVVKSAHLPSALDHVRDMREAMKGTKPVFFLDYDGTLTPITEDPQDARLSKIMAATLQRLTAQATVAIVSGRELAVIKARVGIPDIFYAGSHGYEVEGPDSQPIENHIGRDMIPALDAAEKQLRKHLADIKGASLERKTYSIAVHYRCVPDAQVESVEEVLDTVLQKFTELHKKAGKKVWELQPNLDWDKGNAVQLILDSLPQGNTGNRLPIYIGDDVTDEDAFDSLASTGVGIVVNTGKPKPTLASYRLKNPDQVREFLDRMCDCLHDEARC